MMRRLSVPTCVTLGIIFRFGSATSQINIRRNITSRPLSFAVAVDTSKAVGLVSKRFLSVAFTIGTVQEHWAHFDFASERPFTLLGGLSPLYARFGGTAADWLHFREPTHHRYQHKNFTDFTITTDDLDKIATIGRKGSADMIFGLNVCLRSPDGSWNYTNPMQIMDYVASQGYNFGWELGNEPNHLGKFNRSIPAERLAADFLTLRKILDKNPKYGTRLVGPDVTRPQVKSRPKTGLADHTMYPSLEYLSSFLSVAKSAVDAVTWHQYYFDRRTCSVEDFYDPDILDLLLPQLQMIGGLLTKVSPGKRPWMGETDSAWGGGAAGMSDTYVAGFTWLDKLGLAARLGTDVVMRQSFFHGHYALIDDQMDPNPDYWLSLLHKRLVGQKVLHVDDSLDMGRVVRVYAHCTNTDASGYKDGSVSLLAINLNTDDSVVLRLTGKLDGLPVDQYLLTPGHGGLTSQFVELNGEVLKMIDDVTLPPLTPVTIAAGDDVTLPPLTFGFWVIPDAMASACL